MSKYVCWFSAGITSAVATKIAIQELGKKKVAVCYIETGNHHPDNARFIADCEKWYGCKIQILKNRKFENVQDVVLTKGIINTPRGAPCTTELKKEVRRKYHREYKPLGHVLGFEFEKREISRAERFKRNYPECNGIFPLIDHQLNKEECAGILQSNGIKLPVMYELGYQNNNCIGCVKGGAGYWNKIRKDFPEVFAEFAKIEREIGGSCINGKFLDELDPNEGNPGAPIMPNCGIFCTEKWL